MFKLNKKGNKNVYQKYKKKKNAMKIKLIFINFIALFLLSRQ